MMKSVKDDEEKPYSDRKGFPVKPVLVDVSAWFA